MVQEAAEKRVRTRKSGGTFASDRQLVEAAAAFLETALAAVAKDQVEAFSRLFEPGSGAQMWDSVFFYGSQATRTSLNALSTRVIKKLDHRTAVESDIEATAWNLAARLAKLGKEKPERTDAIELLEELQKAESMTMEAILPNYTYRLDDGVRAIEIGPVRAERTEDVVGRLKFSPEAIPTRISIDDGRGTSFIDGGFVVHMPAVCWHVTVRAAQKNAREEASWLVDIAIELLRLSHSPRWDGLVPGLGHREPPAFERPFGDQAGLLFREGLAAPGGQEAPRYYLVNNSVVETTKSEKFTALASQIFAASDDTLGGRLARALAWITRGRRADDRAQALLFFSTALEALFTVKGADSITGMISRHTAVVWTLEPKARLAVSRVVSNLYAMRSDVIHQGAPGVLRSNVQQFQHIVETVAWRLLRSADLTLSHADFTKELVEASYGLPWPKDPSSPGPATAKSKHRLTAPIP